MCSCPNKNTHLDPHGKKCLGKHTSIHPSIQLVYTPYENEPRISKNLADEPFCLCWFVGNFRLLYGVKGRESTIWLFYIDIKVQMYRLPFDINERFPLCNHVEHISCS